jgi:hypothetical protein
MKKTIVIAVILIALIGVVIYAHFFSDTQSSGGPGPGRGGQSLPVEVASVTTSALPRP